MWICACIKNFNACCVLLFIYFCTSGQKDTESAETSGWVGFWKAGPDSKCPVMSTFKLYKHRDVTQDMVVNPRWFSLQEREHNSEDEDEDKYADDIDMPGQNFDSKRRITVRNLRIREDTAKVSVWWHEWLTFVLICFHCASTEAVKRGTE